MTAPFSTGYPDYGRYSARALKTYVDQNFTGISAVTTKGPFFVGDVPFVGVSCTATANGFLVQVQYGDTSVSFSAFSNLELHPFVGVPVFVVVPVIGSYVRIVLSPSAANSAITLRVWASWTAANATLTQGVGNVLISSGLVSVGSGATTTFSAPYIWVGEAVWNFESEVATFRVTVDTVDELGATKRLDTVSGKTSGTSRSLFLPGLRTQISLTNLTGAAGNMGCALMGRPIGPGY